MQDSPDKIVTALRICVALYIGLAMLVKGTKLATLFVQTYSRRILLNSVWCYNKLYKFVQIYFAGHVFVVESPKSFPLPKATCTCTHIHTHEHMTLPYMHTHIRMHTHTHTCTHTHIHAHTHTEIIYNFSYFDYW